MCGAVFPTRLMSDYDSLLNVLIPDVWGDFSNMNRLEEGVVLFCLNPRCVGRLFQLQSQKNNGYGHWVLIPDVWGGCSNKASLKNVSSNKFVLIPDVWGGFSNLKNLNGTKSCLSLNPRCVGRFFQPKTRGTIHYPRVLIPDVWGGFSNLASQRLTI